MSILIYLIIFYILLSLSLKPLFEKAGYSGIDAYIPGRNFATWCKIIGRNPLYALWLLFPIVNIFIFCGMAVDMVRSFGRNTFKDSALAVIYAPLECILDLQIEHIIYRPGKFWTLPAHNFVHTFH